jgi:hypothetical protein
MARPEPRPSRLRPLLRHPGARHRVGRVVASLLGVGVVAIAAIGILAIWHLVRRGRLIRERLGPPRVVRLSDLEPTETEPGPE